LNDHLAELSEKLRQVPVKSTVSNDVFMLDDRWMSAEGEAERVSADYGINQFTNIKVFRYANSIARFFLPGHKEAKQVYLSGSFNAWSTERSPMKACDSGWVISVKLKPGKYSYKYILDGRWSQDPFNRLT
jgi:1,4-alpha-glucan branching enzyme